MAGKAQAIQALISRLKLITGPPNYHHDIQGRVYTALITPEDGELQMPYLCVFQPGGLTQSFGHGERSLIAPTWRIPFAGFVEERKAAANESTTLLDVAKLEDDVIKAIGGDPQLNKTVIEARIVSTDQVAGIKVGGTEYGELEGVIEVQQKLDVAQLGPSS